MVPMSSRFELGPCLLYVRSDVVVAFSVHLLVLKEIHTRLCNVHDVLFACVDHYCLFHFTVTVLA